MCCGRWKCRSKATLRAAIGEETMQHAPTSENLIPPPVSAKAERMKRLAGAFGPRFFLLLVVGLVWLGAAFHNSRFFYALAAWDTLALLAWAYDLASLPRPSDLTITRRWKSAAALSIPTAIEIVLENESRSTVLATLTDNVPQELSIAAPELELKCRLRGEAVTSYQIVP